MEERFLSRNEVSKITGLAASTIWRYEKGGLFPQRYQITVNRVAWRYSDVKTWMDECTTGSQIAPVGRKKEDAYACSGK